mgnify:CR=1 FL=1
MSLYGIALRMAIRLTRLTCQRAPVCFSRGASMCYTPVLAAHCRSTRNRSCRSSGSCTARSITGLPPNAATSSIARSRPRRVRLVGGDSVPVLWYRLCGLIDLFFRWVKAALSHGLCAWRTTGDNSNLVPNLTGLARQWLRAAVCWLCARDRASGSEKAYRGRAS